MTRQIFSLLAAGLLLGLAGQAVQGQAKSTIQVTIDEWAVTAKAHPHDPAFAPDGGLWYTGLESEDDEARAATPAAGWTPPQRSCPRSSTGRARACTSSPARADLSGPATSATPSIASR